MSRRVRVHCIVLSLAGISALPALYGCNNNSEPLGYRVVEGQVVFEFDASAYTNTTKNGTLEMRALRDIVIDSVSVAGDFNGWFPVGWRMDRTGDGRYALRFPSEHLPGSPPWRFKFLVNDMYWVEPPSDACNVAVTDSPGLGEIADLVLSLPAEAHLADQCL